MPENGPRLSDAFGKKEGKVLESLNKGKEDNEKVSSIIDEAALDTAINGVEAKIANEAKAMNTKFGGKLTNRLGAIVSKQKRALRAKLSGTEQGLTTLHNETLTKLNDFEKDPKVAEILTVVKPFFEKKGAVRRVYALKTYAKGSGYWEKMNAGLVAAGVVPEGGDIKKSLEVVQKMLGIKVDGKCGPDTINAVSRMLGWNKSEVYVDWDNKVTLLNNGKKFDTDNNEIIAKVEDEPKAEGEKDAAPEKADEKEPVLSVTEVKDTMAKGIADISSKNPLYKYFDMRARRSGETIVVTDRDGAKVCDISVDQAKGEVSFTDGGSIAKTGIWEAVKGKIDAHIKPQGFSAKLENNVTAIKFPGEMHLYKYTLATATDKKVRPLSANDRVFAFGLVNEDASDGAKIGSVTMKDGKYEITQEVDSPVVLSVEMAGDVAKVVFKDKKVDEDAAPQQKIAGGGEVKDGGDVGKVAAPEAAEPPVAEPPVAEPEAPEVAETPDKIFGDVKKAGDAECQSDLYTDEDFELKSGEDPRTLILQDPNQYPGEVGCHEGKILTITVDDSGKIYMDGIVIALDDVAVKMHRKTEKYLNGLEYNTIDEGENSEETLFVKFKGEIKTHEFFLEDGDHFEGRTIKKVGGKIVITYMTQEDDPNAAGEAGAIKQVRLATFTISKGGSVKKWLNPKYRATVIANAVAGKITLENKDTDVADN